MSETFSPMSETSSPMPPLEITLEYDAKVNFAMQQNGVDVVKRLSLRNRGEERLESLRLTLSLDNGIAAPFSFELDHLGPDASYNLESVDLQLDPRALGAQVERERTLLRLEYEAAGFAPSERTWPLDVLAHNEWPGLAVLPEIIAAFVLANDARVTDLVARARHTLEAQSGNGAMSGYQSQSRTRVGEVVRAIYDTLAADGLAYLGVPPSFEAEGQKLRFPAAIFEQRQGNCLDLSCLLAAAFEAAGLHPLIILQAGHAFVGVWTYGGCFAMPEMDDAAQLINRCELGEMLVLEATAVAGTPPARFDDAVRAARRHLEDRERFVCALDVRAARKLRIRAVQVGVSDEVTAAPSAAGDAPSGLSEPAPLPEALGRGARTPGGEPRPHTRIDTWKSKLLDLTLRNRFLNFRPTAKSVPLLIPDLERFEDLLSEGATFQLLPRPPLAEPGVRNLEGHEERTGEDPLEAFLRDDLSERKLHSDRDEEPHEKALTNVYRTARNDLEEIGANTLYVALGFLEWYEVEDGELPRRSPIILLPVTLKRPRVGAGFKLSASGDDVRINVTLIEKLKQDYRVDVTGLDQIYVDDSEGGVGIAVKGILDGFRRAVMSRRRWLVKEEAALAILSFSKVTMWEDLEANADAMLANPVVDHLVHRPGEAFDAETLPEPGDTDRELACAERLCPLDADSSQLAAVLAADRGRTFVLQGPPGTGKSQTITNMIAQAIGRGQRVLFVAEKRAALEVVHGRLETIGLDAFCLEVHSNKTSKREVLGQLERAVEAREAREPGDWDREAERLESLRQELNDHARAIHETHPSGFSVFRATSELIALREAPVFTVEGAIVREIDEAGSAALSSLGARLATAASTVTPLAEHPLRALRRTDWSPRLAGEAVASVDAMRERVAAAGAAWAEASPMLDAGAAPPRALIKTTLALVELLKANPRPPRELLEVGSWSEFVADFDAVMEIKDARDALRRDLLRDHREEFLALEPLAEIAALDAAERAWFPLGWWKRRQVRRRLAVYRRGGDQPTADALRDALEGVATLARYEHDLADPVHDAPRRLGTRWRGGEADAAELRQLTAWTESFRTSLAELGDGDDAGRVAERFRSWASDESEPVGPGKPDREVLERLTVAFASAHDAIDATIALLEVDFEKAFGPNRSEGLGAIDAWAEAVQRAAPGLADWCHWRLQRDEAAAAGWEGLVDALESGRLSPDRVEEALRRSFLEEWLNQAIESDERLRRFQREEHHRKIDEFRKVDRRLIALAGEVVAARAATRIPDFGRNPAKNSEVGILMREFRRKRGNMPLRKLFRSIPELLPRLKPCLLMSPLSVAQYIEMGGFEADLVIFDEASQIPVWDAIGAVARARASVIVGDSKQLPPTTFFNRAEDPDEEVATGEVDEVESILDECEASGLPTARLLWHYRSRHEELIAFSNHHYYDDRLLTFPSAVATSEALGVSLRHLPDGVYDRGRSATNQREAEAIVEEIVRRCLEPGEAAGKDSIGVVAFSAAQQRLIEDLLDSARVRHREIEDYFGEAVGEPVFVKNLENVQGDERDVILFSICYGPDQEGRVAMNFGPVNRVGGERRLNVAITRARKQVIVVSSIRAEHIELSRTNALGVRHLKTFLDYADRGPRAISEATDTSVKSGVDAPFERDLAAALRARGHAVDLKVGCSGYRIDLAVKHPDRPDRYVLGIECDGPTWGDAATARDRDRLRQAVLERLDWFLHRVWSSDWWRDPSRQLEALDIAIQAAIDRADAVDAAPPETEEIPQDEGPASETPVPVEKAAEESTAETATEATAEAAEAPSRRRLYPRIGVAPHRGSAEDFYEAVNDGPVARRLAEVIEEEGPVHRDRAYRRVAASWGLTVLTKRLRSRLDALSPPPDGDFLWPEGVTAETLDHYRVPEEGDPEPRPLDEVCPEELAVAAREVLEHSVALPRSDLARETVRLFGVSRLGHKVQDLVDRAIDRLVARGEAVDDGDSIRRPRD